MGCEGTPCLDMAFLFLTLIASLLNGGQLHRLMVGKRPYFFSLEVVRLYDFNQGIQQHAMLPFSGRVHSFEMDVERRGCEFTGGRPSYRDAARSQSTARTAVERWCVSGSIVCGRHSHLVVVQGGDGDAGIAHTALHACAFAVTPHLLQGTAYACSSLYARAVAQGGRAESVFQHLWPTFGGGSEDAPSWSRAALGPVYSCHLERSWFTTGLASMRLSMRNRGQPGGQQEPASHAGEVHPGRRGGHCPGWVLPAR